MHDDVKIVTASGWAFGNGHISHHKWGCCSCLIVRPMEEVEGVVNQTESPEQCVAESRYTHRKGATRALRLSVASPSHPFIIGW